MARYITLLAPVCELNTSGMTDKQAVMAEAIQQALIEQTDAAMRLYPNG